MTDIHDWCFVSGKTNALESGMFTSDHFERLLDIRTIDELHKHLTHSKLKKYFTTGQDIYDYENSLDTYFFEHIDEIKAISPSVLIGDLFLLKYKIRELKHTIKNKLMCLSYEKMISFLTDDMNIELLLSESTNTADFKLNEFLPDMKYIMLNNLRTFFTEHTPMPQNLIFRIIDLIMDNLYLCSLSEIKQQIVANGVKKYIDKFIFASVIKSLLRAALKGCDTKLFRKYFLPKDLSSTYLSELTELPVTEWKGILKKELPVEIVNAISLTNDSGENSKNPNLTRFEKLLDDYLTGIINHAKYIAFGSERVFGYLCGLEVERYNLLLIIGGKINNIETRLLKDRLRNSYV